MATDRFFYPDRFFFLHTISVLKKQQDAETLMLSEKDAIQVHEFYPHHPCVKIIRIFHGCEVRIEKSV